MADVAAHAQNQGVSRELDAYRTAREAGLQPASTNMKDIKQAWKITDALGSPYRADV